MSGLGRVMPSLARVRSPVEGIVAQCCPVCVLCCVQGGSQGVPTEEEGVRALPGDAPLGAGGAEQEAAGGAPVLEGHLQCQVKLT